MRVKAKRLHALGLNTLIFQRLEDMAGYQQKLKELTSRPKDK